MIPLRRPDIFSEPRPMYATCDAGLEHPLAAELEALGAEQVSPLHRGVGFVGDRALMWRINLHSRVASRVLVPIAEFAAPDREALYQGAVEVPWSAWFAVSKTIAIDASSTDSEMDHTGFIAQVVKDGVCDHFRAVVDRRPNVEKRYPNIRINARLDRDHCIISLDSSGERLHRRGYRTEAGEAPLRETLAAGCLLRSGWTPDLPLVDPMCGAGTLVIEAAMIATNTPPNLRRARRGHFSFTHWYGHRAAAYDALIEESVAAIVPPPAPIIGSDVSPEVLGTAARNAERAEVADAITLEQAPVSRAEPPAGPRGVVISNPPYGHRLDSPDRLEALYATLGRTLKYSFGGWAAWLLVGEGAPIHKIGLSADDRAPLRNGPIPCELLHYQIFPGRQAPPRERRGPREGARRSGGGARRSGGGPRRSGRDDRRGPPRDRRDDRRDDRGGPRRSGAYDRGGPRRSGARDDRRGPPRGRRDDRDDRGGPPRGRWEDRSGPRRSGARDDRRGPPRGRDDRGERRGPPRGRDDHRGARDDRRGPPRNRDDHRGPPRGRDDHRGARDDRRGPPRGRDDHRGARDDRRGPPRNRDDHRGPPRGRRDDRSDRPDRRGPRDRGPRDDRPDPRPRLDDRDD